MDILATHQEAQKTAPNTNTDDKQQAIETLADEIAVVAATIDAATHKLLTLIRRFDELGAWFDQGALSCAAWLGWRIGLSPGAAREKVRVARALAHLPLIDEALRKGELSYSKARALTRVAEPNTEETLLHMARHTTAAQLQKLCRLQRQVMRESSDPRQAEAERYLYARNTDDGLVRITIQLPADEAALVMKAADVCAETIDGRAQVDGLVALAEARLRGDQPDKAPVELVVHIDAATATGTLPDEGYGLSPQTCRRLLCDGGIAVAATDAQGETLDVGRKRRTIPVAIERALRLRDDSCQFPGCNNRKWLDAHHVQHWCDGGETALRNLVRVCKRHHVYVHEYGFEIDVGAVKSVQTSHSVSAEGTTGRAFVFFGPGGRRLNGAGWPVTVIENANTALSDMLADDGVSVSARSNEPRWDGLPVDYGLCVAQVCRESEAAVNAL